MHSVKYRLDIDGLRAIAVLSVVLFHFFPSVLPGGLIGVDIFFVISGYLISTIIFTSIDNGKFSFLEFYGRRIRRIFPALITILLFCLVIGWFVLLQDEYQSLGYHIYCGAAFISNFCLWDEAGYFDTGAIYKPLLHLWSLGIEEQFYFIWPLFLFLLWKVKSARLWLMVVIIIASFTLNVLRISEYPTEVFYSPLSRFWELLIGSLLAYLSLYKSDFILNKKYHDIQAFLGLVLIIVALFVVNEKQLFPGWLALLPVIGAFLLISAGKDAWVNSNILSRKIMVWFGLISFPLYLWHWPFISFATIREGRTPSDITKIGLVFVSILLAWLTYVIIEKPLRYGKNKKIITILLCQVMLVVLFVGYMVNHIRNINVYLQPKEKMGLFKVLDVDKKITHNLYCDQSFKEYDYCLQTLAKKEPDAVIIGDSHAIRYFVGLDKYFKEYDKNLLLLGVTGCPQLLDLNVSFLRGGQVCKKKINEALNYSANTESVKTVILVSRHSWYITGYNLDGFDSRKVVLWLGDEYKVSDKAEIYASALYNTLKLLVQSGKNVVLVIEPPEMNFKPELCKIDENIFRKKQYLCSVPKELIDIKNKSYYKVMEQIVKDFPMIYVFSPEQYLCDKDYCWASKGGVNLYQDFNHLSFEGSQYIGQKFQEELTEKGLKLW